MPSPTARPRLTLLVVSVALFMTTLDNLVVSTALPSIRASLGASLEDLQWTVNAYTLSFAVLLLTGAALGDRYGRRRMFVAGLALFTVASAAAALAPTAGWLVAARAIQGAGAAIVLPLTLTLLSEAFPPERRGAAIGIWSGVSGLGVALGPLVGGAVVQGISWHWIFWLNVPVGLVLIPIALRGLGESFGPARRLDLPGVALVSAGMLGVVYGLVRADVLGWTDPQIVGSIGAGVALVAAFVAWELRSAAPMLPMRFFSSRAFTATNVTSFAMFFGTFGSIFFLAQFFQTVQGHSPLRAGLMTLPWTVMPMFVAPVAGILSDRIGARPFMVAGLTLQAIALGWLALVIAPGASLAAFVLPFVLAGTGMALVFAPAANAVLAAVNAREAGQASGATNAIRELGGVFGVAVLATVFTSAGGYGSPAEFTDGVTAALPVAAAVLLVGAVAALFVPGRLRGVTAPESAPEHSGPLVADPSVA